jgi:hypothetical protein
MYVDLSFYILHQSKSVEIEWMLFGVQYLKNQKKCSHELTTCPLDTFMFVERKFLCKSSLFYSFWTFT